MGAYMRKTEILPVCTNNEARDYFAGKGLTYADVTEGDILTLVMLLNKHIKKAKPGEKTVYFWTTRDGLDWLGRQLNVQIHDPKD